MDRRTLIFFIALSLTLFGLNILFEKQNIEQRQAWLEQQKQLKIQQEQQTTVALQQRIASPNQLPLARAYQKVNNNYEFVIDGILLNHHFLTLAWNQTLPSTLWIEQKAYELNEQPTDLEMPVIYRLTDTADPLPYATLPVEGRYDLQLIHFSASQSNTPIEILLGEMNQGRFSLLSTPSTQKPYLALLSTIKGYLPVGIYFPKTKEITPLNQIANLTSFVQLFNEDPSPVRTQSSEKFYVLENDYQQLVFSNHGGALAEINLPFHTKQNTLSSVREIEFDRQMVEQNPLNAHFPAHAYYTAGTDLDTNFIFHDQGALGGYYPLLRRDVIGTSQQSSIKVKPAYYALNVVSEYPELAELVYDVKEFTSDSITFEARQNYRKITKKFSLAPVQDQTAPYCLQLEIQVDGDSRGLWLTSGVPEVEWISGASTPVIKYRITRNSKSEVNKVELPKEILTVSSIYPDWICNSNGFLGTILDPLTSIDPGFRVQFVPGTVVPSRLIKIDQAHDHYKAADLPGYMTSLPLKTQGGKMNFRLFAGPFDGDILNQVDQIYTNSLTNYNPDYIACQTMHGWFTFISEPFSKFLLILMKFFHSITGSWALSIILLTICLRIILYPLNAWSAKSMAKMQQIAPEVTAIQEKYKKDPRKAQVEVLNLYREKGVNPASGCLPLLIQMPFLIGMFDLLKSSFALRGAPFIPGWIDDLTAPDVLFRWNTPIFFIGNTFHLLPVLLGLVMFIQQRYFSNTPRDPHLMTDQQRQQQAMGTIMAVVFALMFYNFPSGLNIYWLSSMLLGMLQQWYTNYRMKKQTISAITSKPKTRKT